MNWSSQNKFRTHELGVSQAGGEELGDYGELEDAGPETDYPGPSITSLVGVDCSPLIFVVVRWDL